MKLTFVYGKIFSLKTRETPVSLNIARYNKDARLCLLKLPALSARQVNLMLSL